MIPVSVLITTYNEAKNLPRCLMALKDFDEVIVIDSNSTDKTQEIAIEQGAKLVPFEWNRRYPKKRQWCLDHLEIKHDYVFWVDGDEVITPEIVTDIKKLSFDCAGYFVKGRYIWKGRALCYGLKNNKLALFDRHKIFFPVVDDLDSESMGEMEGHYQPILKPSYVGQKIGQVGAELLHYACDGKDSWDRRHERYAVWEAQMIKRRAYPKDPSKLREMMKSFFRHMPYRDAVSFFHSYIFKCGFLDGKAGYDFARSRAQYYAEVARVLKSLNANKGTGQRSVECVPKSDGHISEGVLDKKRRDTA